ncbi:MAG: putative porin [Verrucomicrobiia bacterium]
MINKFLKTIAIGLLIAAQAVYSGSCADSAAKNTTASGEPSDAEILLDLLRKKGVLTEQEVKEAQSAIKERKLSKEQLQSDAFKFKVNSAVKNIELFGDARLRYELREGQSIYSDTLSRERYRYRLRVGLRSEFTDNFYGGIRFEPSSSPRSALGTFGDDPGPWGKDNDRINIGQLYLGWKPNDWFTMQAGRMENPIQSSILVWDSDLNPEGLMEKFKYSTEKYDLFATFGQFLYDDVNPENPFGTGAIHHDSFMLAWQVGANLKLNKTMSFQIAPVVYNYTGKGDTYNTIFNPAGGAITGINDLLVVDIPAEFNFKALGLPWKIFGQVAVNVKGSDRAAAARAINPLAYANSGSEDLAYQAGIAIGKSGKKGTWDARIFWLHRELFSLDPNLVDSDLYDSSLNMEGIGLSLNYSITDNIFATLTYGYGDRINKTLATGSGDLGDFGKTYTTTRFNLLQIDLNWRF